MPVLRERHLLPWEVDRAYKLWALRFPGIEIDCALTPFLNADKRRDWLRSTRNALMLSLETVAKKLNVSINTYSKMERNEGAMSIKLATLARAADAMDCELVYCIRPKTRQKFSRIVGERLFAEARKSRRVKLAAPDRQAEALVGTALMLLDDTRVRKDHGWQRNRRPWPAGPNQRSRGR